MKRSVVASAVLVLVGSLFSSLAFALPAKAPAKSASPTKVESKLNADTFSALTFRSIGPAVTSGRVVDIAVDPTDKRTWYVAAAYGGVWKTTNAGTTFKPVFEDAGSSSIGCVTIAPSNPLIVWVGTGENNSQRSVGWGDGVYRSVDGGRHFSNMGLKASEHIGRIVVHPTNPNIVWVAAQGPLWAPGGDRGVYKTTDGGKTWKQVLKVDEWTGANEVHLDPERPEHALRHHLPAPPQGLDARGRRPRLRHLQEHRRRRDVDEAHPRPAGRGHGPHRAHRALERAQRRPRHRRGLARRARHVPHR
jgi:hypothetical protein